MVIHSNFHELVPSQHRHEVLVREHSSNPPLALLSVPSLISGLSVNSMMLGGSFFSPSFPDFTYYCYFTLSLSTFPFLTVLDYRVTSLSISTVTLKVSSPWVPPLSLPPFLDVKSPRHKRHNFVRQRVRLPPKREVFFRSRVNPQKPNILFQFSTLFSKNSLLYPLFTNSYLGKLFSFLLDPFVYLQTVLSFLLGTSLR